MTCPECNGSTIRLAPVPTVGAQGWVKISCDCDGGYVRGQIDWDVALSTPAGD